MGALHKKTRIVADAGFSFGKRRISEEARVAL
jgi:hypothetical protein